MKSGVFVPQHRMRGTIKLFSQMLLATITVLVFDAGAARATTVSLISGGGGYIMNGQSYNETRALDVTVLSPVELYVQSMTLNGINGTGVAEAVIYNTSTHSLIASAQGTVSGGTVTVPISARLISGDDYRIGFYGFLGSGNFLIANFPYRESSGLFEVNAAFQNPLDAFPTNPNLDAPQISLDVRVPDSGTSLGLMMIGLAAMAGFHRYARPVVGQTVGR